jgi:hypothetical protein
MQVKHHANRVQKNSGRKVGVEVGLMLNVNFKASEVIFIFLIYECPEFLPNDKMNK